MGGADNKKKKDGRTDSSMGRREMRDTSRRIMTIALSVLSLTLLAAVLLMVTTRGYSFGRDLFTERAAGDGSVVAMVRVTEGEGLREIAAELKQKQLIRSEWVFIVKSKLFSCEPVPGGWQLNSGMTDRQILRILSGRTTEVRK